MMWGRHMKHKWGRILGPVAYREWQWLLIPPSLWWGDGLCAFIVQIILENCYQSLHFLSNCFLGDVHTL
ncbi:hypothetical protein BVRB_006750 [Beta vulgaris subsp. vulgaris]|uniref:Uncharacterized protein n=1 Tax=Beta vulgaris subsp. vulgaris TaxID=3555 RepID=A0A0J8DXM3_BETVV|nr:hypothetical protein BVRB_006750 [Beta vulgaris subsp. vulgaris]